MIRSCYSFFVLFFSILFIPFVSPAKVFAEESPIRVEIISENETIQAGQSFWVAIRVNLEEGWHIYWKNPGDAGMPFKVEWDLPSGFEAKPLLWPCPEKFSVAGLIGYGYGKEALFLTEMIAPKDLPLGSKEKLKAEMNWLVCSGLQCRPGSLSQEIEVSVAKEAEASISQSVLFEKAREKIPTSLSHSVNVIQHSEHIEVRIPKESIKLGMNPDCLTFFPESQESIDFSVAPVISEAEQGEYSITFKKHQNCSKLNSFKGILVIDEPENTEKSLAYGIESSLELQEGELLSLADPVLSSQNERNIDPVQKNHFEGGLGLALLFAFVGGMILNLMPCVLPVISLKVMSFVKMSGQSRSLSLKHGLVFSLGVILSFWLLASVMLVLRAYGQAVGWGFQLQEPLFVIILASFLFIFALNLFGIFELGTFLASWAGQTQSDTARSSPGFASSFFSGVLATAVATPCTGPFLGSAVGFAVTLPVWQSLTIFTFLALGMCFPYLLLAAFPSYLRFIPKPGPWMETFKQLMGFVLITTVLWLLWVFSAQTDTLALMTVLVGFLCFSFGAWIYGRGSSPLVSKTKKIATYLAVLLLAFLGGKAILFTQPTWNEQGEIAINGQARAGWENFSPERLAQLRAEGKPVLIDFTAKWCLICQANHMVLAGNNVEQKLADEGVVKMIADWTKNDPVITEELSKFGRSSVPLYVLYGTNPEQEPAILPQVLTEDVVLTHLNQTLLNTEIASK